MLLMETICASGIRVSEVCYITVEAARQKRTQVRLKGKFRTILLPGKLCCKLLRFARKNKITSGEIFLTGNGKRLLRRQIWAEMKALSKRAGVPESKVFPHNLRHLFATIFIAHTKILHNWQIFWGTEASRPPESIFLPLGRNISENWRNWDWCGRQNQHFVLCNLDSLGRVSISKVQKGTVLKNERKNSKGTRNEYAPLCLRPN